jgi:hypothetical protein
MECKVCCETYTKRDRKPVTCGHCGYEACRVCTGKYILQRLDATCMNCGKPWSVAFLQECFTKKWFLDTWIPHRSKLLFDREKSMLPETQETRMPGYIRCEDISRELGVARVEEERLSAELDAIRGRTSALRAESNAIRRAGYVGGGERARRTHARRAYFACPDGACRGLVDSSNRCGVCRVGVCGECREPASEGEAHECDPEKVSTFALLSKDTKPCPSCRVPVNKAGGCDQMWCVACDSAFSWSTGRPIVGQPIHNPYYFEYLARLGEDGRVDEYGNVLDDEDFCDGLGMTLGNASSIARGLSSIRTACSPGMFSRAQRACSSVQHVFFVSRERHVDIVGEASEDRWSLRLSFLLGRVDEEDFRRYIETDEKRRLRSAEYVQIIETYLMAAAPLARGMLSMHANGAVGDAAVGEILSQIENVVNFCNEAIASLNRAWNSSLSSIY